MTAADAWEEEAERWIVWAREPNHDSYWLFHRDQFLGLLPSPGALTIDIGCGEGRLTRDLKRLGHRVVGIDISPTMIAAARAADREGDYRRADASKLPLADACCDLAVAFMSLQDVDELPGSVMEIARVLAPGGRAVIAIVHPPNSAGRFANEAPDSTFVIPGQYLTEFPYTDCVSRRGLEITFHSHHRPLESYSRALEAVGLVIEAIREHPVPEDLAARSERSRRWQRVPLFLHLRALKLERR